MKKKVLSALVATLLMVSLATIVSATVCARSSGLQYSGNYTRAYAQIQDVDNNGHTHGARSILYSYSDSSWQLMSGVDYTYGTGTVTAYTPWAHNSYGPFFKSAYFSCGYPG